MKTPLTRAGATSRRHHPNPAEAQGRWRGERSKPVSDHHTRSLCAESPAQSEQWCCWIGRSRIVSGPAEIAAIPALSAIDQRPRKASLLTSWLRPELRFPHAAAQTRIVSVARIRPDSRKSVRPFKAIFCDDISEFESYQLSQPVESLRRDLYGCRNPRHSGRLGGESGVSGPGFTRYPRSNRRFSDAGLCSVNFNIRTGRRETGS